MKVFSKRQEVFGEKECQASRAVWPGRGRRQPARTRREGGEESWTITIFTNFTFFTNLNLFVDHWKGRIKMSRAVVFDLITWTSRWLIMIRRQSGTPNTGWLRRLVSLLCLCVFADLVRAGGAVEEVRADGGHQRRAHPST